MTILHIFPLINLYLNFHSHCSIQTTSYSRVTYLKVSPIIYYSVTSETIHTIVH